MIKLACFIFLSVLSMHASAQKVDTVARDTTTPGVMIDPDVIERHAVPLILLDGVVYKGDLKAILPDNITEVNVVRDTSYIKLYGKAAENGIIFITTRGHKNVYSNYNHKTISGTAFPDDAVYVIDGELSSKKLDGIDPNNIMSIDVLNRDKAAQLSESSAGSVVVAVVTKLGATKNYQYKLSAFSPAYKAYLDAHHTDDKMLEYRIDGKPCEKGDKGILELYKLAKDRISKIKLSGVKNNIGVVDITTKK